MSSIHVHRPFERVPADTLSRGRFALVPSDNIAKRIFSSLRLPPDHFPGHVRCHDVGAGGELDMLTCFVRREADIFGAGWQFRKVASRRP
jgi:hypothetical protein